MSETEPVQARFLVSFGRSADLEKSLGDRFRRFIAEPQNELTLAQPKGIAASDDGQRLYIADYSGSLVVRADLATGALSAFVTTGLSRPFGIALDGDENLFISDADGKFVVAYSRRGERVGFIGHGLLERPTGLAIDQQRGLLFVADGPMGGAGRVVVFTLAGEFVRTLGLSDDRGAKSHAGAGQLSPLYVAVGPLGLVYVGDAASNEIHVLEASGRHLRSLAVAEPSSGLLEGLSVDAQGNLYAIVVGGQSHVRVFDRQHELVLRFGGDQVGREYIGLGSGIAVSRDRRVYVCNQMDPRVNVYEVTLPDRERRGS